MDEPKAPEAVGKPVDKAVEKPVERSVEEPKDMDLGDIKCIPVRCKTIYP